MRWEEIQNQIKIANCACGKGYVQREESYETEDWGQSRSIITGAFLHCKECEKKFHIERVTKTGFSCDGERWEFNTDYLVPNGMTLKISVDKEKLSYEYSSQFKVHAVAMFTKDDLIASIEDMVFNKYSTRIKLFSSKQLIDIHLKYHKSKKISIIVSALKDCVVHYNEYEWTFPKVKEYREKEEKKLCENKAKLKQALDSSICLIFKEK